MTTSTKAIKAITTAVSKATNAFSDGQRTLCSALIKITQDAVALKGEGVTAFREAMLAERELHDCKNIRCYYSTLAGRAVYIAKLDPANCKTLSGLLAQTEALIALATKEYDVAMAKKKADALAVQATLDKVAVEAAQTEQAATAKLDALADSTDEVTKAAIYAEAKAAKLAAETARKAKIVADKQAATAAKQAESASNAAAKVTAKEAKASTPKQMTATAPASKSEPLAPQPQQKEKQEATNIKGAIVEAHSIAAELSGLFATFCLSNKKSIKEKIVVRIATLETQLAHVIAELPN
jgi:hypothetical protein